MWYAGRLTEAHPITDRLDGFGRPGRIEACSRRAPDGGSSARWWARRDLHALHAQGFLRSGLAVPSGSRRFPVAETAYFHEVGYVPGMHLIGFKAEIVAETTPGSWTSSAPDRRVAAHLAQKREKYADTTPWMFDERRCAARSAVNLERSGLLPRPRA
jgi:4,5-dihydroxyphthalate decarboxylase